MAFCIVEEDPNYHKYMLSILINIDFIYKNYDIVISCCEMTKNYILNFPLEFNGNINWILLDNLDNNNIRYIKNILYSLDTALDSFKEVIYIDSKIDILNKIIISEEIKTQGIGFVSRSVGYMEEYLYQKYITNILFINDKKYINYIENFFSENINEWNDYNVEKFTNNELRDINTQCNKLFIQLGITLKQEFDLKYFFNNETLISSEDFFAYQDKIELKNIDQNFKIAEKFIIKKDNNESKDVNDSKDNNDSKDVNESISDKLINICALNIRMLETNNFIINLNKELYSRMAEFNIIYMLLINLKYSNNKIEFVIPNKDGVSIWDRNNDPPGLYELIDMIIEKSEYFGKTEAYIDYFSFNNFMITDKPSYYWLNNTIRKYTGVFLCNYDNTIEPILKKIDKLNIFGFYYSDYPKLLEEIRGKDFTKKRYCIEVYKNKIVEYQLSKKKTSLLQKSIININSPEKKLNIIGESTLCLFNDLDINLLANCLGLKCVPVFRKSFCKSTDIYDLKENINYIVEPEKWSDIIHIYELSNINTKYFTDNIVHTNIIKNILNKLLNISKLYREDREN